MDVNSRPRPAPPVSHYSRALAYVAQCTSLTVTVGELDSALSNLAPTVMEILVERLVKEGKLFPIRDVRGTKLAEETYE